MIKHILFDADGVLVHAEMWSNELQRRYGVTHEQVQPFYRGIFQETLSDKRDLKEIIEPYLKEWGWPKTVDAFLNEWFEYEHILDEAFISYIQKLRAKGIKCYVATNQEKYRGQYMIDKMGFGNSFDKVFVSAHLGTQKPAEQFFHKIVDELGANKDEVLFWDDDKQNIAGAKEYGIHAEFFESFDKFKDIMKDKYEISI